LAAAAAAARVRRTRTQRGTQQQHSTPGAPLRQLSSSASRTLRSFDTTGSLPCDPAWLPLQHSSAAGSSVCRSCSNDASDERLAMSLLRLRCSK
jgi:hypothetical protein